MGHSASLLAVAALTIQSIMSPSLAVSSTSFGWRNDPLRRPTSTSVDQLVVCKAMRACLRDAIRQDGTHGRMDGRTNATTSFTTRLMNVPLACSMLKGSEWPNLASRYTYTDRYSQQIYLYLQIYLLWALNSRDTIHAILGQMLSVRICHACMQMRAESIQPASSLRACVGSSSLARTTPWLTGPSGLVAPKRKQVC